MSSFETWFSALSHREPDLGGVVGTPALGLKEFYKDLFNAYGGPVPPEVRKTTRLEFEMELIREAISLLRTDLSLSGINSRIDVILMDSEGPVLVRVARSRSPPACGAVVAAPAALPHARAAGSFCGSPPTPRRGRPSTGCGTLAADDPWPTGEASPAAPHRGRPASSPAAGVAGSSAADR